MLGQLARGLRAGAWAAALAYPLAVYWTLTRHGPAAGAGVGIASALLWSVRAALLSGARRIGSLWALPLLLVACSSVAWWTNDPRALLAVPVAINAGLLIVFVASLLGERSYVEQIARLQKPELTPDEVRHCRQFTWIWAIFFVVNGGIALALSLAEAIVAWTIYTSILSYGLIALLLGIEVLVRRARFGKRHSALEPRETES